MKRMLIVLSFLFVCAPLFALTDAEIIFMVRYQIHDTTDTINVNTLFSDDVIRRRANVEQKYIARQTKCVFSRSTTTPVYNQAEYTLPSGCIEVDRVTYLKPATTSYDRLTGYYLSGLDNKYPGWESYTASQPRYYYTRAGYIGLCPRPSTASISTGNLRIDYYKEPSDMDSSDDQPFDGNVDLISYHDLVVMGTALWFNRVMGKDVSVERAEYNALIEQMKIAIRSRKDITTTIDTER